MIIYKIENKINGKIYIGQTKNCLIARISGHSKGNAYIGFALRKYGLESFIISVIDEADTKPILGEKEKYWIKFFNCKHPNGYNLTIGGEGLAIQTEEINKRRSLANLGRHHTEEELEKMRKPRPEGFGEKLSKAKKGKIPNRKGYHHSEETLQRMRKPHGPISDDHRRHLSESHIGQKSPNKGKKFPFKKRGPYKKKNRDS